jgi:hypothetical protein
LISDLILVTSAILVKTEWGNWRRRQANEKPLLNWGESWWFQE